MSGQVKKRTGGVLPINPTATKKTNAQSKPSQKSPAPKLRLIVRRLPPGLTEAEFWEGLGTEWQTNNGKVDWHAFKEGKVSKDPSKPSRPGRAYLKVKDQSLLDALSSKVKVTTFRDARNTSGDSCLVGPPSLEFAPYNKSPSGRHRHDGRQGTIDQDQEFIDFLQSLTEPITKPIMNGAESTDAKQAKVLTTPLVQFIKEKKANKAKEKEAVAAAKSSKKSADSKEAKIKAESRPTVVVKSSATATEKSRVAKATQEVVKVANKTAAQIQNKTATSKAESKAVKDSSAPATPTTTSTTKPERQRGSASAASRMIARDLGLAPKEPRTPRAAKNTNNTATATSTPAATAPTLNNPGTTPKPEPAAKKVSAPPVTPSKQSTQVAPSTPATAPPTGPRSSRSNQTPQTKQNTPAGQRTKAGPQPSAGAKSAFLKHANPSQGVTEDLLRTVFSTFGDVVRCEIDKKKGLGYVDFGDTEALKKAMAASPVKVGNGQVVVLENKSPYQKRQTQTANTPQQVTASVANSRSRPPSVSSSTVVSAVTSPQPVPAVLAVPESTAAVAKTTLAISSTQTESTSGTELMSTPVTQTATAAIPAAPRSAKGSNPAARGGRGGNNQNASRGAATSSPNRGRGGFRGRGGRGSRPVGNTGVATTSGTSTSTTPTTTGNVIASGESSAPASGDKPSS